MGLGVGFRGFQNPEMLEMMAFQTRIYVYFFWVQLVFFQWGGGGGVGIRVLRLGRRLGV